MHTLTNESKEMIYQQTRKCFSAWAYAEIPTGISAAEVEPVRYVASAKAECNPRRGSGLLQQIPTSRAFRLYARHTV